MTNVVPKLVTFSRTHKLSFEIVDLKPLCNHGNDRYFQRHRDLSIEDLGLKHIADDKEDVVAPIFMVGLVA